MHTSCKIRPTRSTARVPAGTLSCISVWPPWSHHSVEKWELQNWVRTQAHGAGNLQGFMYPRQPYSKYINKKQEKTALQSTQQNLATLRQSIPKHLRLLFKLITWIVVFKRSTARSRNRMAGIVCDWFRTHLQTPPHAGRKINIFVCTSCRNKMFII